MIIMVNKSSRFRDYDRASSRQVFTNFLNTDLRLFINISCYCSRKTFSLRVCVRNLDLRVQSVL